MKITIYMLAIYSLFLAGVAAFAGPADRQPDSERPLHALITASPTITTTSKVILAANPNRYGLILYNNSSNSVYIAFADSANSSTQMTLIIGAFGMWAMPAPIYRGTITGIRNAGTGTVLATELLL